MSIVELITWIQQHKRRLVLMSFVVVIVIVGAGLFNRYAVVFIELTPESPTKNIVTYTNNPDRKTNEVGGAGMVVVQRDTQSIVVTSGNYIKTRVKIAIPWYGFVSKRVNLQTDKDAEKIAFQSKLDDTCTLYWPRSEILTYYNCTGSRAPLMKYTAPAKGPWKIETALDTSFSATPLKQYGGGLIGMGNRISIDKASDGDIVGINEFGERFYFDAPDSIPESDVIRSTIFTDKNNLENTRFVVVGKSGDIFIGTPRAKNTADYQTIPAPSNYDADHNQTLCALDTTTVYCYRGPAARGDTHNIFLPKDPPFDFSTVARPQIVKYSLVDNSEKTFSISGDLFSIDTIDTTAKGEIFVGSYSYLYHLAKSGDTYKTELLSNRASSVTSGNNMYFAENGGIYVVDSNDTSVAYQVFYSPNISVHSVYAAYGKVFALGESINTPGITYAYSISNKPNTRPGKRLLDIIPLDTRNNPDIYRSDLVGDRILISLLRPSANTTQEAIEAYGQMKQNVLNSLTTYDIPFDESRVSFISAISEQ